MINVFAFKVNTIDKGYVNIGPQFVADWNGLSKQNFGNGDLNGDANVQSFGGTVIYDQDGVDVPIAKTSVI